MTKKKKPSARTQRRETERRAAKDVAARLALARLEPGGAPDRAVVLTTAALVEPTARAQPCAVCGEGGLRVVEHTAPPPHAQGGRALRVALVECGRCGWRGERFFSVSPPQLN